MRLTLPSGAFAKQDVSDGAPFYRPARFVTHVEDDALAALTAHHRTRLSPGANVLDLTSSCFSHLPPDLAPGRVIGQGTNSEELAANAQLDAWLIRDLNRDPQLPSNNGSQDAVFVRAGGAVSSARGGRVLGSGLRPAPRGEAG